MDKIGIKLLIIFVFLAFMSGIIAYNNVNNIRNNKRLEREIIKQVIQDYFSEIDSVDYYRNLKEHSDNINKLIKERLNK